MPRRAASYVLAAVTALGSAACSSQWAARMMPPGNFGPQPPARQSGNVLYVANLWGNSIFVFNSDNGRQLRTIADGVDAPVALAQDGSGNLFVTNAGHGLGSVSVYPPGSAKPVRTIAARIRDIGASAVDSAGDVFVANHWANRVYEYASGTTRIARTITQGVVAVNALAVDSSGYLYVSNCQTCRYLTRRGTVTVYRPNSETPVLTIRTGHGGAGPIAFDPSDNAYVDVGSDVNVYARHTAHRLRKIIGAAGLLYFDGSGNLYAAQHRFINSGGRVLVYPPGATTPLYVITKGIYDPEALTADTSGNLYVANPAHNDVAVYSAGSSKPSRTITVATGLEDPESIALDDADNLYVANTYESTVTVYPPGSAKVQRTITSGIVSPSNLTFDGAGNLYVGNFYGNGGGSITSAFITVYAPGKSDPKLKIVDGLRGPTYVQLFDQAGNLYVGSGCPAFSNPITVYAPGQRWVQRTIGQPGIMPCAMAFDSYGNLYVASVGLPGAVWVFAPGSQDPVRTITDGIDYPNGLAFDRSGNLYVTNAYGGNSQRWGSISIYRPGASKPFRRIRHDGDNAPGDPVLGPAGNLFVVYGDKIVVYAPGGAKLRSITRGLHFPTSLTFDRKGNLYVANVGNSTITVYAPGSGDVARLIRGVKAYPDALVFGPSGSL
jgi:sugar lactone lactonase YvrE